jgi:hypothetical protein
MKCEPSQNSGKHLDSEFSDFFGLVSSFLVSFELRRFGVEFVGQVLSPQAEESQEEQRANSRP